MKKRDNRTNNFPNKSNYSHNTVRKAAIKLIDNAAKAVRSGHPWIFKVGLANRDGNYTPGRIYSIFDSRNRFLAKGIYEKDGAIAFRIVTRSQHNKTDDEFFRSLTRRAFEARNLFAGEDLTVYRLVNAEGDRIPGLTVTRYGDYLLGIQYLQEIDDIVKVVLPELHKLSGAKGVYLQKRFRPSGDAESKREPGRKYIGEEAPLEIEVVEDGAKYLVDITAPMGIGFFPDYRDGRRLIRSLAKGRKMLNLFSHTGAFSIAAIMGGAEEVVNVDLSQKANTRAQRNMEINGIERKKARFLTEDIRKAVSVFNRRGEKFSMAVVDPPTFAKGKTSNWSVRKDYRDLVQDLLEIMEPGALILFTSNTAKMDIIDFEKAIANGSWAHSLQILTRISLPYDYPQLPGFPEGSYLKSFLVKVD